MKIGPDMVIVCATDFSSSSRLALDAALATARGLGAAGFRLLHVDETIERFAAATDAEARFAQEYARLQDEARALTEKLAAETRAASGLQVVAAFRTGSPYLEIVRYADEERADLVVVGSHGRTGLKRVIMGSVAERVVRHAHCAVLTVKGEAAAPAARA